VEYDRMMFLMKMATAVFIIMLAVFTITILFCYGALILAGGFLIMWGFSDVFTGQNGLIVTILKILVGCLILIGVDKVYDMWRGRM